MSYPRIGIVSRRSVRKDKYIDYVGEFHLDLIAKFKALPVIIPRIDGVIPLIDSIFPIHGLLLTEGEDIGPQLLNGNCDNDESTDSEDERMNINEEELKETHSSDANPDESKDLIESYLIKKCLKENIPILAICRGSQILNVINGGKLYKDIELQHESKIKIQHINYNNYDNYRHDIKIIKNTPLFHWFYGKNNIKVNSYHHQGIYKLAKRFKPMAFSPDNLIESFYDPKFYDIKKGKFIMAFQFHPERMFMNMNNNNESSSSSSNTNFNLLNQFIKPYEEFIIAAFAFQKFNHIQNIHVTGNKLYKKRNHLITPPPNFNMSDEDIMTKIINSGASVHGVRILRDILSKDNQENNSKMENVVFGNNKREQNWDGRLADDSTKIKRRLVI